MKLPRIPLLLREFLGFGSTTVAEQVSRTAVGLVAASHLGPSVWGGWYLLNLVLRYGALSQFGVLNGMNREYPMELGRGNPDEANKLRRSSLGFLLVTAAVTTAVGIVAALVVPSLPVLDLLLTLMLLCTQQLFTYVLTSLKADTRFGDVSRLQLISAILQPGAALPLLFIWGLHGFILGQAVALALVEVVFLIREPLLFRAEFDWRRARSLVRIGFPVMLVGVLNALFMTVDRWVIVSHMDIAALGQYSLPIMALGATSLLPMVVGQQFYPRMSRSWGERHDWQRMLGLAVRQGWLAFGSTVPVVVVGWLVGPPIIRALLPAYTPGIIPMMVVLGAPVILSFGQGFANVLNVTDHQYRYVALVVVAIVTNAVLSTILVRGYGLVGVSVGTLLAFVVFSGGLAFVGQRTIRGARNEAAD